MKKDWEIRKLSELCELITKGTTPTSLGFNFTIEGVKFIKVESLTESGKIIPNKVAFISEECHNSLKRSQLKENDILFSIAGALGRIGIVNKDILPANTNQALAIIRLKSGKNIMIDFLSKYFQSNIITEEIEKLKGGAAQQNLSLTQLNNLNIPIPPLSEQKEIVSILDHAFESIELAKSNAEKNLKNAKELFESYLRNIFEKKGKCWEEKNLGELIDIKNGKNQQSVLSENGKYKIMGSAGNTMGFATDYICEAGTTIIGRKGNISTPIYIDERFWNVDTAFGFYPKNENDIDKRFIYYLCLGIDFKSMNRGTTIPSLVKSELQTVKISLPKSLKEQQNIVLKLDALIHESKKLETIYKQKLNDLEELKKSILQKAFNGELKTSKISA
jgi:type I restriction enzyme S subunit